MKCEVVQKDDVMVIKISGELDQYNADKHRIRIDMKIITPDIRKIILDISELSFIDSSGVGFLIGRFKTAKAFCKDLSLVCSSPYINKILTTCGIERIIKKYKSIEEALQ